MTTLEIINEAKARLDNVNMRSSAEVNIKDAIMWLNEGNEEFARYRALKALQYSVGIMAPIYIKASKQD